MDVSLTHLYSPEESLRQLVGEGQTNNRNHDDNAFEKGQLVSKGEV